MVADAATAAAAKERSEAPVVRPTEAQLRWAQFHHKKRATAVRAQVERLWQTPADVSDVPEALPDDGVSSSSSSSSDDSSSSSSASPESKRKKKKAVQRRRRRRRPKISRGRRALLRVSQRAYETRRADIERNGFQCRDEQVEHDSEEEVEDSVIAMIADDSARKRRRKRRWTVHRRGGVRQDEERVRRFEAAYRAMMMNLMPQEQPEISFDPSKRWTRSGNVPVAVSIDGRQYDDLKWGFTRKKEPLHMAGAAAASTPFDRRASWLVHLPVRQSLSSRHSYGPAINSNGELIEPLQLSTEEACRMMFSPGQVNFDQLVAALQQQEIENQRRREAEDQHALRDRQSSAAKFRQRYTSRYGSSEADDQDGSPTIERLQSHHSDVSPLFKDRDAKPSPTEKSDTESEFWRSARNMHDTRPEVADLSAKSASLTQPMQSTETGTSHVAQQRRTSEGHNSNNSSQENVSEADFWHTVRNMHDTTPNLMDSSVAPMARIREEQERTAGRYVAQEAHKNIPSEDCQTPSPTRDVSVALLDQEMFDYDSTPLSESSMLSPHPSVVQSDEKEYKDKFLERGRSTRVSGHVRSEGSEAEVFASPDDGKTEERLDESERLAAEVSSKQHESMLETLADTPLSFVPEDVSSVVHKQTRIPLKQESEESENPAEGSSRMRLGAKVGGFINSMFSGKKGVADDDELRAVAAFRKIHDERREQLGDDATSTSSFRVLPDGIRRVVQNFTIARGRDIEDFQAFHGSVEGSPPGLESLQHTSLSTLTPPRSTISRSGTEEYSPEHGKFFHQKIMEHSPLIGGGDTEQTIIDTDDTTSSASGAPMDPKVAASLFLSPTILTKRLKQAIRAIEKQKWDQVSYLLNANPWLAEMTDVTTEQYLLHKLALYGVGATVEDPETGEVKHSQPAPEKLNLDLIRMFPASVHKFDQDGNLPLHMAAVSGNKIMVKLLGERFPSGASVRNNEGLLPLHLAIQACPSIAPDGNISEVSGVIKTILKFFPAAVAVADNEGNLPIHSAASTLHHNVGVDVVYMLLDEASRRVQNGSYFRVSDHRTKLIIEDEDDAVSVATETTATPTDSSTADDDSLYCNLVRNEEGCTPLVTAIRARAGWEMIEALASGPGGKKAALQRDATMCNALHLLVGEDRPDPASILSILKVAPETASMRNGDGALPIELACMKMMTKEVILAMALVDLPIDLEEKKGLEVREGFGGSWWFLTCECDDHYIDIVLDIVAICSYAQLRELCFMKGGPNQSSGPVISRATPKCQSVLRKALRFVGRFEFMGSAALEINNALGLKVFEAIDFGSEAHPYEDGRRVLLRCYGSEAAYLQETKILRDFEFDSKYVEEVFDFAVQEFESSEASTQQFFVVVERPSLTLDQVVAGMLKNDDYRTKADARDRYLSKVSMVLRLVAKSLRHLHQTGVIHGNVCLETSGKFDDTWKLTDLLNVQRIGNNFSPSRMGECVPPEALEMLRNVIETRSHESASRHVTYRARLTSHPSIDVWGFGKVAYEVLTGIPLIHFDPDKHTRQDNRALRQIFNWNEENLGEVVGNLRSAGVTTLAADLISHCLLPNPSERPSSMDEILDHPFWKDMRRKNASNRSPSHGSQA